MNSSSHGPVKDCIDQANLLVFKSISCVKIALKITGKLGNDAADLCFLV
jgi:hypothetical protein